MVVLMITLAGSMFSVRFSPDGQRLITSHKDGQVRYWDWKAGKLVSVAFTESLLRLRKRFNGATRIPGRWSPSFAGQRTAFPFLPHDRTRLPVV